LQQGQRRERRERRERGERGKRRRGHSTSTPLPLFTPTPKARHPSLSPSPCRTIATWCTCCFPRAALGEEGEKEEQEEEEKEEGERGGWGWEEGAEAALSAPPKAP
jgi:hypothetical protein